MNALQNGDNGRQRGDGRSGISTGRAGEKKTRVQGGEFFRKNGEFFRGSPPPRERKKRGSEYTKQILIPGGNRGEKEHNGGEGPDAGKKG